jgi:hypothetical protein
MKIKLIFITFLTVGSLFLFAQGTPFSKEGGNSWRKFEKPYDATSTPTIGLSEAYSLTLAYLGPATNRFYCISASCLEKTKRGLPGWTILFANTNGERAFVEVSFDKEVDTDARSTELLRKAK